MKAYAVANLSRDADERRFLERVERLARSGIDVIQLRAKELDDRDLVDLSIRCRERIGVGTTYLINGRADIAVAAGAEGVQLPANGVPVALARAISPSLIVGRSCHSLEEVERAAAERADLVLLGPLFDARSEEKKSGVTRREIEEAARLGPELFVIGGLTRDRLDTLQGCGATGIAAITLFMEDEPLDQIIDAAHGIES